MNTPPASARRPKGAPTGGQFAPTSHAEASIALSEPTDDQNAVGAALHSAFRAEIDVLERRWRDEADVDGVFNGLIVALGQRVLAAAPSDQPGYTRLAETLVSLREQMAEEGVDPDDTAEEVLYCLQDLTEPVEARRVEQRSVQGEPGQPSQHERASAFLPSVSLTIRDVEHLIEHRGRFEHGYDSDDINRVLGQFESAQLVCVWDTFDDLGYGGSSEFAGIARNTEGRESGSWRTVRPEVWEFLSVPDTDLDPETIPSLLADEVFDGPDLDDMPGDGLSNRAPERAADSPRT